MDWITGIQNAINYIEDHLTDEIDYEQVAKESFSSGYQLRNAPEFDIIHWFYKYGDEAVNESRYTELWLPIEKKI